jgi:hypothetical protein
MDFIDIHGEFNILCSRVCGDSGQHYGKFLAQGESAGQWATTRSRRMPAALLRDRPESGGLV